MVEYSPSRCDGLCKKKKWAMCELDGKTVIERYSRGLPAHSFYIFIVESNLPFTGDIFWVGE